MVASPSLLTRLKSDLTAAFLRGILFGGVLIGAWSGGSDSFAEVPVPDRPGVSKVRETTSGIRNASPDAQRVADWVANSGDAAGMAYIIIDKRDARLLVFDHAGVLRASSPVLLGSTRGDHTVPGIGDRAIADVLPHERTTPAGRYVGERGRNARGEDVVWIDYDSAVSIHRVVNFVPAERRLERLASSTPADNRISYGCVNVPHNFYETYVSPMFKAENAIIYVLPEVQSLEETFKWTSSISSIAQPLME